MSFFFYISDVPISIKWNSANRYPVLCLLLFSGSKHARDWYTTAIAPSSCLSLTVVMAMMLMGRESMAVLVFFHIQGIIIVHMTELDKLTKKNVLCNRQFQEYLGAIHLNHALIHLVPSTHARDVVEHG